MTHEEWANEVVDGVMEAYHADQSQSFQSLLIDAIAAALREVERDTLEQAAQACETFTNMYDVGFLLIATKQEVATQMCVDIAELFHDKARQMEAKP